MMGIPLFAASVTPKSIVKKESRSMQTKPDEIYEAKMRQTRENNGHKNHMQEQSKTRTHTWNPGQNAIFVEKMQYNVSFNFLRNSRSIFLDISSLFGSLILDSPLNWF